MTDFLSRRGALVWMGALALALAFIVADGSMRMQTIQGVTETVPADRSVPRSDAASPTGYEGEQHRLVLPAVGTDGYHWVLQTERMVAGEGPRIREVAYDNHPDGRESHWSVSLRWWLAGVAWGYQRFHPELSLPQAMERVVPWANTLILALLVLGLTPLLAWRFGTAAGALFAVGSVALYPFYEYSMVGYYDHHGIAAMACFGMVVFLVAGGAGWVRVGTDGRARRAGLPIPSEPVARRWFAASAVSGGAGLWISAATVVPVMFGIGIAALVGTGVLAGRSPRGEGRCALGASGWRPEPRLWRVWGAAGALTSLAFYLLEYFPGHLGMRLEVNHPLYALAWLGAGDLLFRTCRWLRGPASAGPAGPSGGAARAGAGALPRDWPWMGLDLAALALLPAVVLLRTAETFQVADPFLWALHADYITEFQALRRQVAGLSPLEVLQAINLLPVLALPLVGWLWSTELGGRWRWGLRSLLAASAAVAVAFLHAAMVPLVRASLEGIGALPQGAAGNDGAAALFAVFPLGAAAWFLLVVPARAREEAGGLPRLASPERAAILLALLPAAVGLVLSLRQVRWLGVDLALWLGALVVAAAVLTGAGGARSRGARAGMVAILCATLLPFPAFAGWAMASSGFGGYAATDEDLAQVVTRDVSHFLRARLGDDPGVVVSGPTTSTWMIWFGGFRGLGTLYWENVEGLRAAASLYGATSEEARARIEEHGVTHIVVYAWEPFVHEYARLAQGLRSEPGATAAAPPQAFMPRLVDTRALPPWLIPVPYAVPRGRGLTSTDVRLFEVVPEQPPEITLARIAQYHLTLGEIEAAEGALAASLETRQNLPALALHALVLHDTGRTAAFLDTVERIRGRIAETEAVGEPEALELGDRVNLGVAFAQAGDAGETERQITAALDDAEEGELRRLPPEALYNLVSLSRQLGLAPAHQETLGLARDLLPPGERAALR